MHYMHQRAVGNLTTAVGNGSIAYTSACWPRMAIWPAHGWPLENPLYLQR
jgi:hypothetical protein